MTPFPAVTSSPPGSVLGLLPLGVSAAAPPAPHRAVPTRRQAGAHRRAGGSAARHAGAVSVRFSDPATVLARRPARVGGARVAADRPPPPRPSGRGSSGRPRAVGALPPGLRAHGYHGRVVGPTRGGFSYLGRRVDDGPARAADPDGARVGLRPRLVLEALHLDHRRPSLRAGLVELEAPVARYLPGVRRERQGGRDGAAVPDPHLRLPARHPAVERLRHGARADQAVNGRAAAEPARTVYLYSDLNLITLGVLVQRMTGKRLDEVVRERITQPLGMSSTATTRSRTGGRTRTQIAATSTRSRCRRRAGCVGSVHER